MELEIISENLPATLTIIVLTVVVIEWIRLTLTGKIENQKESWVNIFSAGLAFLPQFLITKAVFLVIMFWAYHNRFFDTGFEWYYWIIAWVIYDFSFWLIHFLGHKVRLLWCLHSVHHSAKEMKLSVGFRGSLFDVLIVPHTFLWLPLLGFNPFLVLIVDAVAKLYGVAVHINEDLVPNKKRRWFERIVITPSAHRVHHSTNHAYLDTNYGETLVIWDRMFNTYQVELDEETPRYGVMKEVASGNLYDTQFNEFIGLWKDIKSTKSIINKLKYLFMPPGWSHKGETISAKKLREEALLEIQKRRTYNNVYNSLRLNS